MKLNGQKIHHLNTDKLSNANQDVSFQCYVAIRFQKDVDDEAKLKWFGNTLSHLITVDQHHIVFPAFSIDDFDDKCVIRTNTTELLNAATTLFTSQSKSNAWPVIKGMTFSGLQLPIHPKLIFIRNKLPRASSTAKRSRSKVQPDKLTIHSIIKCNNCDDDKNHFKNR